MKITLGEVEIECTPAEFRELYPLISSIGRREIESRKNMERAKGTTRTGTRNVLQQSLSKNPEKIWSIKEISADTGIKPKTIWKHLNRMVKERAVEQIGKGQYRFLSQPSNGDAMKRRKESLGNIVSERFEEMLHEVRAILSEHNSCSEDLIKRHFRKLPSSTVESFLSEAIRRGLLKENLGIYSAARLSASAV